ncbi:palmitoyltransferase ZDHHC13 isoform X1 [Aquila chrysaetos chrysaetos]|uniref:palmitoyltransferase ZDHHC13 isoform X1 n=2 Tax=Aquila chrysaetos chrysaetos TaxID=223781 RepID=UPI001B7D3A7E|nr:palmitoyltransferase ZDHHC13 isoform X1 [Aquila chrysaetos chrysaetos]
MAGGSGGPAVRGRPGAITGCKNHCHGPHRPHMHNCHSAHGDKDLPVLPGPYPIVEDPSTCDIVKATQYGIVERCKELVEAGYDVRQPDKENVTLLHWAAINNRQELVKYYISKGAIVDQLGGDLNSTPLHWAIRQGHLPMVMLLLKCGADPSLIDGEGFSSIHLAVLFQHMPIIAYLISKGQNVDTTDFNGQTPLMLSAQKAVGPEPTRFLLKFNPSLSAVDNVQKNTALHWAITSGNTSAVDLLLEAGASLDIKNAKGETPLDLAYQSLNRFMVYMVKEEERMRSRRNNRLLKIVEKYELFLLLASSLTLMWAIGYVMNLSSDSWLLKGGLLLFLLFGMALFVRQCVGLKNLRYLPTAFLLSSVFWMSVTCFFWFLPGVTSTILEIAVVFSMVGLLYYFYKTWRTDPGYVKTSEKERKENIVALAEAGCLDFRTFCTSCLVRKPLRSMHCLACDSCVAKYDHHSVWIGQCIGIGNHCYYLLFLSFLTMTGVWLLYGTLLYWSSHCATSYHQDGAWAYFTQIISCSPWVSYIFAVACFHTVWASLWLTVQLYQIAFLGLTSHERRSLLIQRKSSKHPVSLRRTPYNLGCFQNLADFFQCSCFGMFKPNVVDWTKQYNLFHLAKEKNVHSV